MNHKDWSARGTFWAIVSLKARFRFGCPTLLSYIVLISAPFGTLKFSHGEGHLLYCAERNSKAAQYFDADLEWDNDEKIIESKVVSLRVLC
ncbi:unnamed protein product [Haemonchus placei]|uniref:Uncharacterized protein n=1 Tax=Haemonchus placei TaxID=6290 RepID=A0A0N4VUT5_HAEPC|nr:unnamed protein product [Haemonchus placei]VDO11052.1 unnamed protein product [Haemonchus placei]